MVELGEEGWSRQKRGEHYLHALKGEGLGQSQRQGTSHLHRLVCFHGLSQYGGADKPGRSSVLSPLGSLGQPLRRRKAGY